ncbi:hypothetical protein [Streptomyces sp. NPDC057496]|uniref:hypothetical protein n=1 Tax=Streptomyces sp. NPDC057496 TaxID=3346149 RepID=UPI00368A263D
MFRMKALPDVPRWAVLAAHAVPLVTLPSALWRIALATGVPVSGLSVRSGWEVLYIVSLTVITEGLALLTLGLVQPWGEVVPRWIPLLGGRGVRPLAAVAPALLGAAALSVVLVMVFHSHYTGLDQGSVGTVAQRGLLAVCYFPLLAWPPLLAAVAVAYHRRRAAGAPARGWEPDGNAAGARSRPGP